MMFLACDELGSQQVNICSNELIMCQPNLEPEKCLSDLALVHLVDLSLGKDPDVGGEHL